MTTYDLSITMTGYPSTTFSGSFSYAAGQLSNILVSNAPNWQPFTQGTMQGNSISLIAVAPILGNETFLSFTFSTPLGGGQPEQLSNVSWSQPGDYPSTCGGTSNLPGPTCTYSLTTVAQAPELPAGGLIGALILTAGLLTVGRRR